MRFSVVIPLYNKEEEICETVKSALGQGFADYEVIIVNDGSTDRSIERLAGIHDDRLRIIHQENQGVAVARNTGIEHAHGEFVAFLDADDIWQASYLETSDNLIKTYEDADIFVTAYTVDFGNGRKRRSADLSGDEGLFRSYWLTYRYAYDMVWTSATVIRRSALLRAGMFTPGELIGQDLDMWSRVARNNPLVAYSSKELVCYNRVAGHNARRRVKVAYPKAFLSVLEDEMSSDSWSSEEKRCMLGKYNKKMTVYVFTTILSGERREARNIIRCWKKEHPNHFIVPLYISSFTPNAINRLLYEIRLRVF